MKIKFIKSTTSIGYCYSENDCYDLKPELAKLFIEDGFAILDEPKVKTPKVKTTKNKNS